MRHDNLLSIIRDEFSDEKGLLKIKESSYKNTQNKSQPMFELTFSQAKRVLMRESKSVRGAVIDYIEKLENELSERQPKTPADYLSALKALVAAEEEKALLKEQNETLKIELNENLEFRTVAKYNTEYKMQWDMKACQAVGKGMSAYCRKNSIQIRKCKTNDERFGSTNSYPLTAWQGFLEKHNILGKT